MPYDTMLTKYVISSYLGETMSPTYSFSEGISNVVGGKCGAKTNIPCYAPQNVRVLAHIAPLLTNTSALLFQAWVIRGARRRIHARRHTLPLPSSRAQVAVAWAHVASALILPREHCLFSIVRPT